MHVRTCDAIQLPQQRNCPARQPQREFQIKFRPRRPAQLSGAHEQQQQQMKRDCGRTGAAIVADTDEKLADLIGILRRSVLYRRPNDSAAQHMRRIDLGAQGWYCVGEYLADQLSIIRTINILT